MKIIKNSVYSAPMTGLVLFISTVQLLAMNIDQFNLAQLYPGESLSMAPISTILQKVNIIADEETGLTGKYLPRLTGQCIGCRL